MPSVSARMCDSDLPEDLDVGRPQFGRSQRSTRLPPVGDAVGELADAAGKSLLNRPPGVSTTTSPSSGPTNSWTTIPPLTSISASAMFTFSFVLCVFLWNQIFVP